MRTIVTLRLSREMVVTDEEQFPHVLMLRDTQFQKLRTNNTSDIKFSKAQITKMSQSGDFLVSLLRFGIPLLENVIAF